ncbi:hypothetical protein ACX8Z9_07600 [Arthrobacter halodurans]|uniref:Uncharacterized protein n=1 Tax=Arthrobacter halodurans TaxID=516699 RepID=A0ABV4UN56_9MICC
MQSIARWTKDIARRIPLSATALRWWGVRQWGSAAAASLGIALLLGFATVLIPNDVFTRDIAPTPWSYPVWLATSLLSGLLLASYVRAAPDLVRDSSAVEPSHKPSRWGLAGGLLAWFAVGCPVCNKIALLALGYSGAITYFAPVQPLLAGAALAATALALVFRLSGQVECLLPARPRGSLERTAP